MRPAAPTIGRRWHSRPSFILFYWWWCLVVQPDGHCVKYNKNSTRCVSWWLHYSLDTTSTRLDSCLLLFPFLISFVLLSYDFDTNEKIAADTWQLFPSDTLLSRVANISAFLIGWSTSINKVLLKVNECARYVVMINLAQEESASKWKIINDVIDAGKEDLRWQPGFCLQDSFLKEWHSTNSHPPFPSESKDPMAASDGFYIYIFFLCKKKSILFDQFGL